MDIIFDCPNCQQELAVDGSGAGTQIECPSCSETITIPQESTKPAAAEGTIITGLPVNPITSSAAAKIEKHLKVPLRDKPGEPLLKKVQPAVVAVSKSADKKIRVHTIRHAGCVEFGRDTFDEKATDFLNQIGEANLIGIHMTEYTYLDVGTQKIFMDFGMVIVYRG
jgi:DNA-directed RNA polymerase subunit RPC12/RpoP